MFEITFLGTAAATPAVERGLPALLVAFEDRRYLVDCGEGTQRQLLRSGHGFRRLHRILMTHVHLDHVLGLGGLISSLGLLRAGEGVAVHGSGETLRFVAGYLHALWPEGRGPVAVELVLAEPGEALIEGELRITPFAVPHRGTESLGYRFETASKRHLRGDRLAALGVPPGPERARLAAGEDVVLPDGRRIAAEEVLGPVRPGTSVAVVGDAEAIETLVAPVTGADALVIEATFLEADAALARARGHLTAAEAGRLAAAAGVRALHLTHLSGRYDPAEVAAEARRFFPEVHLAEDFARVRVAP